MANSHCYDRNDEEGEYCESEYSNFEDYDSDVSEEDPTYDGDLDEAQSKLSKLSIKTKSNSRAHAVAEKEIDDGEVSDNGEMCPPKVQIKDVMNLEQVQKIIDAGQVEKLKVEQCKIYLRKHGLRLTGKKDTLIQRIKEHVQVLNAGGERKYPPSSFVLNCKGDACMGDIVMFEQTVYEGYNIASRSSSGPPCGKRVVAGQIVKESYGAAKQQHTFTVEVLWSKGHKPLPPLYPLLIKGRNLYRLNTMRQRWEHETERQRVLSEKHSRGSVARSNREVRIQEKSSKKTLQGMRALPKEGKNSYQSKNIRHETGHVNRNKAQEQQRTSQVPNPKAKIHVEFKEDAYPGMPRSRTPAISHFDQEHKARYSNPSHVVGPPPFQHYKAAESTAMLLSHLGYSTTHHSDITRSANRESYYSTRQLPDSHMATTSSYHSYARNHLRESLVVSTNYNCSRIPMQRPSQTKQQLCRYYPQGRCYYGNQCKFLHE